MINDCRRLLTSDLATSDVRFIRRQANEGVHSFSRVAFCHASFYIHIRIISLYLYYSMVWFQINHTHKL